MGKQAFEFERLPRSQRRQLLEAEARARKSGAWGEWERVSFPRGSAGNRWAAEFDTAHRNRVFAVLERALPDGGRHLMISSLSGVRPTWWETQRIKNEIAGADTTAVEIYPPQAEVVDDADAYHLWVLPGSFPHSLAAHVGRRTAA
jgi:hypothetical protein